MTTIEKIIEALSYAEEENTSWIEYFNSPEEARTVLKKAQEIDIDDIDECEFASLVDSLGIDPYEIAKEIAYYDCLAVLEEDLHETQYTD